MDPGRRRLVAPTSGWSRAGATITSRWPWPARTVAVTRGSSIWGTTPSLRSLRTPRTPSRSRGGAGRTTRWGPGASRWSMDDRSSVMSDWQRVLDWLLA
jgi:hypothetical protein